MRVVFLGTPEFAVPSLDALVASGHSVLAVYTQPDRPKGRGQQLAESPVKQAASRLGIPIFQPERIRRPENFEQLRAFEADLMVVVGYGQIIPQSIIDLPQFGYLECSCFAAAEVSRRGPHSMGDCERRDHHGRHDHADRRRPGYGRHARQGKHGDWRRRNRAGVERSPGCDGCRAFGQHGRRDSKWKSDNKRSRTTRKQLSRPS